LKQCVSVCMFLLVQANLQLCGHFLVYPLKSLYFVLSSSFMNEDKLSKWRKKVQKKRHFLCKSVVIDARFCKSANNFSEYLVFVRYDSTY